MFDDDCVGNKTLSDIHPLLRTAWAGPLVRIRKISAENSDVAGDLAADSGGGYIR